MPYQKTKEGRLVNEITLGDGYPLSNNLQPLKIGGEASVIEISHPLPDGSDNGLFKVNGDLDITGTLKTKLSHDLIYDFDDEVNTLAQAKVDALIDSAPAALDTLNELAAALGDDANFATTVTNSLALKAPLAAPAFTGDATFDSTTLAIDSTNNRVGIGTTSPIAPLQIESSVNAFTDRDEPENYHLLLRNPANDTGEGTGLAFLTSAATDDVGASIIYKRTGSAAKGELQFYVKATTDSDGPVTQAMTIDDSANVGIGNTSPNHLLHVGDDATATFVTTPDKAIQLSSTTNDEEIAYILYSAEGANNIRSKYFIDDDIQWVGWDSTYSTGLYGYKWQIAGNDKMVLTTAGNVGIGTTSPAVNLHVKDDSGSNTLETIRVENSNGYAELGAQSTYVRLLAGGSLTYAANNSASYFYIGGSGKMGLTSTGLGIGTTSPTTTLDVEGTVSYKHTAFSTAGPTDNIDVSDTTVLEVDTSSNNVIIGGFTGGVQGQILYIVKTNTANFIQLEHNEGGGSQDIFITTGSDERVVGYGGYTLYCNGTSWFSLSNPTGGADAG